MRLLIESVLFTFLASVQANKFEFYTWGSLYKSVAHGRLDPIISPGKVSAHVHTWQGSGAIKVNANGASLAKEATLTSMMVPEDKSLYWAPSLYGYDGKEFTLLESRFSIYWQYTTFSYDPNNPQGADVRHAFPLGMQLIGGNMFSRFQNDSDPSTLASNFQCQTAGHPDGGPYHNDIRTFQQAGFSCDSQLRGTVGMPSCWDGVLDNADLSHVVYPVGYPYGHVCPPSHPKAFMALIYEYYWATTNFFDPTRDDNWVLSFGDTSGYGFHGDFLSGWDEDFLQSVIDGCTGTNSFGIENCTTLASYFEAVKSGVPVMPTGLFPNEPVGIDTPLDALPGCNPLWTDNSTKPTCASSIDPPINLRIGPDLSNWNYIGCPFGTDELLDGYYRSDWNNMTVDSCLAECKGQGFEYAGMTWGMRCRCGNTLNGGLPIVDTLSYPCSIRCYGNSQQFCGGNGGVQVYQTCTGNDCFQNANISYDVTPVASIDAPTQKVASQSGTVAVAPVSSSTGSLSTLATITTQPSGAVATSASQGDPEASSSSKAWRGQGRVKVDSVKSSACAVKYVTA